MDNVDFEAIQMIIIVLSLIICIVLFFINFITIFNFKWYIDFIKTQDAVCSTKVNLKFEAETIRYNLSKFFKDNYHDIQNNYKNSFYTFVSFYTAILLVFIGSHFIYNISLNVFVYVSIAIIYIVYTIVNSIIAANFENINSKIYNQENVVFKYNNVYKILNAIVITGNIYEDNQEFSDERMNLYEKSFKDILDSNISSFENEYNTNKINQLRNDAEQNVDVLKYLTLDQFSPFYLKYFDNIYINITKPDFEAISETVYIKDLYNKKSDIDFQLIRNQILELNNITRDIQTYKNINNLISDYPSTDLIDSNKQYNVIVKFIKQIKNEIDLFRGDLESSNKIAFDKMTNIVSDIESAIKPKYYSSLIDVVNEKIHNYLTKHTTVEIENKEYIQYLFDNSHILLNSSDDFKRQYGDVMNTVTYQSEFAYAYFVFWSILALLVLHYLFIYVNNVRYSAYLISILITLLFGFYLRQII